MAENLGVKRWCCVGGNTWHPRGVQKWEESTGTDKRYGNPTSCISRCRSISVNVLTPTILPSLQAEKKIALSERERKGRLVYKKKNTVKIVAVCSFCEMTSSTYKMELVHSARFSWLSVDNVKNAKWSCDCKMTGFVAEVGPSECDRYKLDDSQQADHAWVK